MGSLRGRVALAVVGRLAVEKRASLVFQRARDCCGLEVPVAVLVLGDGPERPRARGPRARLGLCAQLHGLRHRP
jgi:hypothetical protein